MSTPIPYRNQIIRSEARQVIYNVFQYFKNSKTESQTLRDVKETTSLATGISTRTIERVVKEGNKSINEIGIAIFSSPKTTRRRKAPVTGLSSEDTENILRIIREFEETEGYPITIRYLRKKLDDETGMKVSETSLRRILDKLGLKSVLGKGVRISKNESGDVNWRNDRVMKHIGYGV